MWGSVGEFGGWGSVGNEGEIRVNELNGTAVKRVFYQCFYLLAMILKSSKKKKITKKEIINSNHNNVLTG